ncbi:phenylalanine--tRNA ligase subunit beta [Mucilaginibacter myungsuensis]|uniref:Phenylalanine--tRNA ligase beta subunit n=1 Tax=Mucilaginibacter myungsuensis TaxID=649104 RepID=A0A929PYH9_9SPHI|nr:phenylalanine--tRNA ligase subunit beta [Mucilaginibacter myungsuensis]MBE9664189.1 phenylalanine--tRNA ligase subunit beta [Mucilaginibacter myungsuensis]MDN3599892.1 phenylalanine--tRNA ligase subunit beta [Mucilaginibacter myungsuensis]
MKISYNWLKEFIAVDKTPAELSAILTGTGLEVESLEKVQAVPGGLEGLVIGYVKECTDHPNSDHLHLTKVDVGGEADLSVVCGASNVAAGQKVVVATVGTTVHPVSGEPFKIKESKIRGEVSQGMLCAEDEIGLGASHDGIMVLPEDAPIGTPAKGYFKLNDDYMYEIGLTPNRADAASHLGTARDIAAFLKLQIIKPDVSAFKVDNHDLDIAVEVENTASAPRYSGLTMTGLEVKESPQWLKERLAVIGVRSINNVVDVTNYVLHELGQPLHAFDADAITGGKVIVKNCAEGTPFTTLDEVERKLNADDLMICNTEEPMCIAGVFGGTKSGVSEKTTKIFLESAYFDAVAVRKTSKRFGLKTDASFRFERGTDPDMTVYALKRAALLIREVAGGTVSSEIFDNYPAPVAPFDVEVTYKNIHRLIGQEISHEEIRGIITALDIQIVSETEEGLSLKVPPYRVDVTRDVDVIEEILRIYGYNNIAIPTQIRASLNNSNRPEKDTVQNAIADWLSANGFNEILSNSLTKSAYSDDLDTAVKILNPLSSDLDIMRQTMLFSGLEAIAYNANRRAGNLKFYEFGKTYSIAEGKYKEDQHLSVFLTGSNVAEQWNQQVKPVSFYNLKAVVDSLLERLNIKDFTTEDTTCSKLSYGLNYMRGPKRIVKFGEVKGKALKKADVDQAVFYADFNFDFLLQLVRKNVIINQEIPKYPSVRRDLSMLVDKAVTFNQLKQVAQKTDRKLIKEVNVFDVYEGDKLPAGKKSYALSFIIQDDEKTLADKAIDSLMQKLILNLGKEAGAEIRK